MNNTYILIPSRIGSTRLNRKPLIEINGESLIQRVYKNAQHLTNNVFVATDSDEIKDNLSDLTDNVIITSSNHISGTDRVYEAATIIGLDRDDLIINLQGDEPFLPSNAVNQLVNDYKKNTCDVITLSNHLESTSDLSNPNCVKVDIDMNNFALDFFRLSEKKNLKRHVGVYGYSFHTLNKLVSLDPTKREIENKLEQLRFLDHQFKIYVSNYGGQIPHGIDTEEDVIKAQNYLNNNENNPES